MLFYLIINEYNLIRMRGTIGWYCIYYEMFVYKAFSTFNLYVFQNFQLYIPREKFGIENLMG